MIFATQSQWSQATMTYSLLVRKLVSPPPSSFPGSPPAPRFPTEPELDGLPPLHKHWRSIPAAASLTLSTFQPDCASSSPAAAHVRRSDRKLARAGPARPVSPRHGPPATGCRGAASNLTPDCGSLCLLRTPAKGEIARLGRNQVSLECFPHHFCSNNRARADDSGSADR